MTHDRSRAPLLVSSVSSLAPPISFRWASSPFVILDYPQSSSGLGLATNFLTFCHRETAALARRRLKPLLDRILALRHKHPTYRRIAYVCMCKCVMCSRCSRGTSHPDGSKRVAFARKIDPSESHPSIFFPSASFNFAREAPPKFIRIR